VNMDDPITLPDEQKPSEETKEIRETANPYLIPGAIIAAGVLIAFAVVYSNGGMRRVAPPKEVAGAGGAASEKVALYDDSDPFLGNPDAPVIIVEFSDFQCPFCGRFFQTAEPQIIEKYVKTGKVKFVYRDFAFLGDESEWAGIAAECAGEQGKFWQYHDYLFQNQQGENGGAFSKTNLKRFAGTLGLDTAAFNSCFDSEKYRDEVLKDTSDGRALGVSGTPTVFINDRAVVGALPFEEFAKVIEEELAK
jgi:protein-disulfide isomerase